MNATIQKILDTLRAEQPEMSPEGRVKMLLSACDEIDRNWPKKWLSAEPQRYMVRCEDEEGTFFLRNIMAHHPSEAEHIALGDPCVAGAEITGVERDRTEKECSD